MASRSSLAQSLAAIELTRKLLDQIRLGGPNEWLFLRELELGPMEALLRLEHDISPYRVLQPPPFNQLTSVGEKRTLLHAPTALDCGA